MTTRITDDELREMGAWDATKGGVFFRGSWPDPYSLARELLLLRARLAYIASHGGAWEKRVALGELDKEATA